jgi:phosphoribosylformylglycinamidine cyclo-ligase
LAGGGDIKEVHFGVREPFGNEALVSSRKTSSYASAGVDINKVRSIHRSLGMQLEETFQTREGRTGVPLRPIGLYGGVIDMGDDNALTLHTDGVGTKVILAQELGKFDTVGIDCVAMTVNDLICLGSEPISLLDYIALEKEDDLLVQDIGRGLVRGAKLASVAIVGGETAIMGDVIKGFAGRGFDLACMGVGVVRKDRIIDGSAIAPGDSILGVQSSGLHSNGYTLARKVFRRHPLNKHVEELGCTLGESLIAPTSIYVKSTLKVLRSSEVHGIAHITGGSFTKLRRLTGERRLSFSIQLPPPPPLFRLLQKVGHISDREMYSTFNMGVGLCLCLPERELGRVGGIYEKEGFETFELGKVKAGTGVAVNDLRLI